MAAAGDAAGPAPQNVADATHDLYRQYGKQIYAYCLHQLRSREEAEDAVQTTFLNAFRGLQRGTTTRFEQAWLYKIAQNVCIARRSSSGRRLKLESPDDFEILQEVVPSSAPADGDTLELMGLDAALDSMPENQRRAILMREWQGMSYREISTELGLTQGAVEMLIFRARRTLAHALAEPTTEKKTGKARTGFSLGSLIAALKPLFSTGAALKMAAVAVSAAVVTTNGVVHSVITHVSTPAKKRAVATPHLHVSAVPTFVAARPATVNVHRRTATRPVAPAAPHPAPVSKPAVTQDVAPPVQSTPAPTPPASVPSAAPVMTPPQLTPAPAPAETPTPTPAPAPATPSQTATTTRTDPQPPPPTPTVVPTVPPATDQATPAGTDGRKDDHHGRHHDDGWKTWNSPQQPAPPVTTTPTPTPVPPTPIVSPAPVMPDPVTTTTTTSTTPPPPATTPVAQPAPPPTPVSQPSSGDGQGNGGDRTGWGNGGGGNGHHGHH